MNNYVLQLAQRLQRLPNPEDLDRYAILVTNEEWAELLKDLPDAVTIKILGFRVLRISDLSKSDSPELAAIRAENERLRQEVADLNLQLAGANARAEMADSRVQQLESSKKMPK